MDRPTIKDDNINYYTIETDPGYDLYAETPEKQKELEQLADKYLETDVKPHLMHFIQPCPCRQREMIERAIRRSKIMGAPPSGQIQVEMSQEDVDMRDFGVTVDVYRGVPKAIRLTIVHCKNCGHMQFYGDLAPVIDLLSRGCNDFDSRNAVEAQRAAQQEKLRAQLPGNPEEYVLEDTETGEISPATDLIRSLVGGNLTDKNLVEAEKVKDVSKE